MDTSYDRNKMSLKVAFYLGTGGNNMREITIYECEKCGKQSENRKVIQECEASHIGLTIEEVKEWKMLQLFHLTQIDLEERAM